jgi:hypothetical protein
MDFHKRANELHWMLTSIAKIREDERLLEYIESIDVYAMDEFSLFIFIGSLNQYFSDLSQFSEYEIELLHLDYPVNNSSWRRIKLAWAE